VKRFARKGPDGQSQRRVRSAAGAGPSQKRQDLDAHVIVEQAKSLGDKPILIVAGMFPSVEGVIGKIFDILDGEVPPVSRAIPPGTALSAAR
jgi:hypothetical protein